MPWIIRISHCSKLPPRRPSSISFFSRTFSITSLSKYGTIASLISMCSFRKFQFLVIKHGFSCLVGGVGGGGGGWGAAVGGGGFPWAGARGKPRRGMMRRAVFSDTQRRGLERRFQLQKYISKPDRKKLAEKLGLKDSQVNYGLDSKSICSEI